MADVVEKTDADEKADAANNSKETASGEVGKPGPPPPTVTLEEAKAKGLPSIGSALHPDNCKPCIWHVKDKECKNGMSCCFCHTCTKEDVKRRRKMSKISKKEDSKAQETQNRKGKSRSRSRSRRRSRSRSHRKFASQPAHGAPGYAMPPAPHPGYPLGHPGQAFGYLTPGCPPPGFPPPGYPLGYPPPGYPGYPGYPPPGYPGSPQYSYPAPGYPHASYPPMGYPPPAGYPPPGGHPLNAYPTSPDYASAYATHQPTPVGGTNTAAPSQAPSADTKKRRSRKSSSGSSYSYSYSSRSSSRRRSRGRRRRRR